MKVRSALCWAAFFSLSAAGGLHAGAWPQKKSGYFLKWSVNYLFTTREFNHEGRKLAIFQERLVYKNTSFRDVNLAFYGEYGLTSRLTWVASLAAKVLTSKRTELIGGGLLERDVTVSTAGVADLFAGLRYGLRLQPVVLSVQSAIKLPLGYERRPENDGPPLGTGDVDVEWQLLVGRSLFPVYLTGGIGYRYRSGPLHDEWFFSLEAGAALGPCTVKLTVDGLKNTVPPPDIVGQPITTPLPGGGGTLPNIIIGDQDIFKISPSVIVRWREGWAFQVEALHIFAGKNTISGTIYSLGLVLIN